MISTFALIGIFLPAIACPFVCFLHRFLQKGLGYFCTAIAGLSAAFFVFIALSIEEKVGVAFSFPWIPFLQVSFSFYVDGLSLFFALLTTFMGMLIFLYSAEYMQGGLQTVKYYVYLLLFMTFMLGAVCADNLILFYLFWKGTSLFSYFLISLHYWKKSRIKRGSTAFLTMLFGDLCLVEGLMMLFLETGTYQWTEIIQQILPFAKDAVWLNITLLFLLVSIFAKSAQIPFSYWLPNAMCAPTPVSAYLHAATVVNLGIYFIARIYPLFVNSDFWFPVKTTICFTTMVFGAFYSLFSHDLKKILAYATVSQLGFFIAFYGMGGLEGVEYDMVHILNHAFYKGSLFLLVGGIEQATGIRDLRKLGGLWRTLPWTTVIFLIAALAMAGVPGTTGFLSKELVVRDLISLAYEHWSGIVFLIILVLSSIFKVAFSIRLVVHLFLRPSQGIDPAHITPPSKEMLISPLILSLAALYFGLFPKWLNALVDTFYVPGLHVVSPEVLQVWHGWTGSLLISLCIFVGGAFLFGFAEWRDLWQWREMRPFLLYGYEACIAGIEAIATRATLWTSTGFFPHDVALPLLFTFFVSGWEIRKFLPYMSSFPPLLWLIAGLSLFFLFVKSAAIQRILLFVILLVTGGLFAQEGMHQLFWLFAFCGVIFFFLFRFFPVVSLNRTGSIFIGLCATVWGSFLTSWTASFLGEKQIPLALFPGFATVATGVLFLICGIGSLGLFLRQQSMSLKS